MNKQTIMTFPCPSCQKVVSLTGSQAVGPCPYCHSEIQATFTVNVIDSDPGHNGPLEKGYDARCFRPDARHQGDGWRSRTPAAR